MNGFATSIKENSRIFFKEITTGPPGKAVNIFDQCAASEIHHNIHDNNALFENKNASDHTSIPIKYRQNDELACGYFSLASALHHVQDQELGETIYNLYHNKDIFEDINSQIKQYAEIIQKKGKKWVAMNMKKQIDHITC